MQQDFDSALKFVLDAEGGYSDDPDDPGGATCLGIEQTEYNTWRRRQNLPVRSVAEITKEEAGTIYRESYWNPVHGDYVATRTACVLFDTAVNMGVGAAIKMLQEQLNVPLTCVFDQPTSDKYHDYFAEARTDQTLALAILTDRDQRYKEIAQRNPKEQKFLPGWLSRVNRLRAIITTL